MLTKAHLKYTSRSGSVYPKYVSPTDAKVLEDIDALTSVYSAAIGQSTVDIEGKLKKAGKSALADGLRKLLEERCEFSDEGFADLEAQRWQYIEAAKALRLEGGMSRQDFQDSLSRSWGVSFAEAKASLYGDLPYKKLITKFEPYDPKDLVHRFNCAQIQGLLMQAKEIKVVVDDPDLVKRRRLFQKVKFHGLIASLDSDINDKSLRFVIGGPMSIFEGSHTYGSRLANFFPYLLHMKAWQLEAQLKLNQKALVLKCDSKKKIKSHYKDLAGYIPDDLQGFLKGLNDSKALSEKGWKAMASENFINLGGQNYCFPDITLVHKSGSKRHIEIFHRWHQSQLQRRLGDAKSFSQLDLVLAVPKKLVEKLGIKQQLQSLDSSLNSVIEYSTFPTVRAVLAYLDSHGKVL
ncbi:DUF790 family protein [Pseudobacteriovorax antillogorgiicola]|uniref:Predicted nuclease of restriction endonuclease-like (RecB) superfamily, implicated in nucleotide excision repair n=1 Tax=Pseudobacteriovorax antillogorgiicola TaxID=1513793 RepID=A0A1Y6B2V0_9BACT|nr:DUF790 family protein [Pseudobacteriovorax antillogorgiicola]TCS59404.1 putative nuclease of restriction endonuclease-like RecB superfamily [Pseudobacteriovorax antillogorgiicola]SME88620.1 Predicted nuclease of restriction endonuclease-like (RecB) superfamily, implicated in nucleotide excision repair [Pseudobacteriovorax antillogorgiicola]